MAVKTLSGKVSPSGKSAERRCASRSAGPVSMLAVPGFEPLITHLFQAGAEYLDSDVVFGTKAELVVEFEEREPGPTPDGGTLDRPWLEARYDFVLQRRG